MATQHAISKLLNAGATPTKEEARHLSELGRFAAALIARYFAGAAGGQRDLGARHAMMVAALEGRLSHGGASKWMQAMGLGAAQLADGWHGVWRSAGGLSEGYQRLDGAEMELFELLPDAVMAPFVEADGVERPRRGSLFGPRASAPHRPKAGAAPRGRTAARGRTGAARLPLETLVALRGGGHLSLATLEALAVGGLPMMDQLELGTLRSPTARTAAAPAESTVARPSATRSLASATGRRPSALLDGLGVDSRTPALAGALGWAEQAFGTTARRGSGLSVSHLGTERLLSGPARTLLDAGRGGARPVFGFFDSVEGEFLSLERPQSGSDSVAADAQAPPRRAISGGSVPKAERGLGALAPAAAQRERREAPLAVPRTATASAGARAVATSLSTVVPRSDRDAALLRPATAGVFSNPVALRPSWPVGRAGGLAAQLGGVAPLVPAQERVEESDRPQSVGDGAGRISRPIAGMIPTVPVGRSGRAGETRGLLTEDVVYDAAGRARARESRGSLGEARVMVRQSELRGARPQAGSFESLSAVTSPSAPASAVQLSAGGPEARSTVEAGRRSLLELGIGSGAGRVSPTVSGASILEAFEAEPGRGDHGPLGWRLAADMGPDLPLGATLSSPERLAGRVATRASLGEGAFEGAFRPIVSGALAGSARSGSLGEAGQGAGERRVERRYAGADEILGGVAWVALEREAAEVSAPSLPMAAVPSGRRAVMAPAAAAYALAAEPAAQQARAVTALREALVVRETRPSVGSAATLAAPAGAGATAVGATPATRLGAAGEASPAGSAPRLDATAVQTAGPLSPPARRGYSTFLVPAGTTLIDLRSGSAAGMVSRAGFQVLAQGATSGGAADGPSAGPGPAPTRAGALAVPTAGLRPGGPVAGRGTLGSPQRPDAPSASSRWVEDARAARRAIQRVSVTGREWMETEALVSGRGPIAAAAAASSRRMSATEPSLMSNLLSRSSLAASLGIADVSDTAAVMGRIEALVPEEAARVGRVLRSAGWAEAELAMLQLAPAEPSVAAAADSEGAPRRTTAALPGSAQRGIAAQQGAGAREPELPRAIKSARKGGGPVSAGGLGAGSDAAAGAPSAGLVGAAGAREAWTSQASGTNRMARNLARVLTGSAALTGAQVGDTDRGAAPRLSLDALLGGALGTLGGRSGRQSLLGDHDYFEGLAPARAVAGASQATLRDAIGELLSVARAELGGLTVTDSAVRESFERQIGRLESAWRTASGRRGVESPQPEAPASGAPWTSRGLLAAPEVDSATGTARVGDSAEAFGRQLDRTGRAGRYAETERDFVVPTGADVVAGDGVTAGAAGAAALRGTALSLSDRLASAIHRASRGPAGLERLTSPVRTGAASRPGAPGVAARGLEAMTGATLAAAAADPILVAPARRERVSATGRGHVGEGLTLSSVLAPEAMLGGLWSSVGADAGATAWRGSLAGDLTTVALGQDGAPRQDAEAPRASETGVSARAGVPAPAATASGATRPGAGRRQVDGRREQIVSRISRILERAGVRSDAAQDVLVDALARNVGRGRQLVSREHGAMAEFSWAWLGRVDGSRSGIDLELQGDRDAFARVFSGVGARPAAAPDAAGASFAFADQSPIHDAGLVSQRQPQPAAASEDRSGVRRVARAAGLGRPGAARPAHRAAEAARQTNWRFVETGSRASAAHADLGRLAATVLSAPDVGRRVPMPLVMPAVKAVAQTALREGDSTPGTNVDSARGRANQQAQQKQAATESKGGGELSEEALEALAHEFADRIGRRMKREQERRGLCR